MSYCEIPEFYHETFPKARKAHSCVECMAPIEAGEKHLYYRLKFDGEFFAERQHMLCRELCMFLKKEFQGGECIPFGYLFEEWQENPIIFKVEDREKKARSLMAGIKWRHRKHRSFRKRDFSDGSLWRRKWGNPNWLPIEDVARAEELSK